MATLVLSNSKVGTSSTGILIVAKTYTAIPFIHEMYSDAFSFMLTARVSAYFFISSMMATPMSAIIRLGVALP